MVFVGSDVMFEYEGGELMFLDYLVYKFVLFFVFVIMFFFALANTGVFLDVSMVSKVFIEFVG